MWRPTRRRRSRWSGAWAADAPTGEIADEALASVSGGGGELVDKEVYVDGEMFMDSFRSRPCGYIRGRFVVQNYIAGRPAEYQLKPNIGWLEESSLS